MRTQLILTLLFFSVASIAQKWTLLITDNLNNWQVRGGGAQFTHEDGVITAECLDRKHNTFLCTKSTYQDFILEFEILVDPVLNSGVQIRSHSLPEYQDGRVHGLQVEVDPSARRFTGGIYDEARRQWLYPVSLNEAARDAFVNGQWNKIRVEATGHAVRTWVNGVACANLNDAMVESGFIALQAHAVYADADVGKLVKWRNVRIATTDIDKFLTAEIAPEHSYQINELTEDETTRGWKLLWDGKMKKSAPAFASPSRSFDSLGW